MFRGRFEYTLDEKGRVKIPPKFKEVIKDKHINTLVLTVFDECIYAYPYDVWEELEKKAVNLPLTNKAARRFKRMFFSSAQDVNIDKQGRILIPSVLREDAEIDKDVVILGNLDHIEIWSKQKWENESKALREAEDELAEEIEKLGIF
ncbi:division/cell wall cluster transcriptional repressor MraZ [Hippea alviniae]|uniref:division/cell wall cluster transcriptional repressor MraZ n=1 Tax=Hippea alviniae TaxID=1279027 RepID=UPI000427FE00|nr:division/cell wall cluster transcriptional repressor MraZ [Hippea alviniae]